ncbi:radical SAM protein [Candidatus Parcubacteria bacterium]|nr:radical SAM protein [Candidatus Parcubacteria bacterium]
MKIKILQIADKCNNNCRYCLNKKDDFLVDFAKIKKEISKGASMGCEQIVFCGKEPSLFAGFIELISEARNCGYKTIQVKTNARMFAYKDFCKNILRAGLTELSVHLYAADEVLHDSLTRSKGSFRQTIAGIKNVLYYSKKFFPYNSCSVNIGIMVCPENINFLKRIVKILSRLKTGQFFFIATGAINNMVDDRTCNGLRDVKKMLEKNNITYHTVGFLKDKKDFFKPYLSEKEKKVYNLIQQK